MSAFYYTHMGVLDLIRLCWVTVQMKGKSMGRCALVGTSIGSKFIIFGGHNHLGFLPNKAHYFEVNQSKVQNLQAQANLKEKQEAEEKQRKDELQ